MNVGIAPLPVETSGQPAFVPSWTDAWSTFPKSQHPEQALDLLTFMATEGNKLRLEGGAFPLDQQLAKDSDYAAGNPARQQMLDVMGLTRPIPFVPGWFSVFGQLEDTFTQVIDNGDAAAALHESRPSSRTTSAGMGDLGPPSDPFEGRSPMSDSQPSTLSAGRPPPPGRRAADDRVMTGRRCSSCRRGCSGWCS